MKLLVDTCVSPVVTADIAAAGHDGVRMPVKLKLDKSFQPCPAETGDELFPNGIFEFNITRLLAFVAAHAGRFPIERVEVGDIPDYGSDPWMKKPSVARICPGRSSWRRSHPDFTT